MWPHGQAVKTPPFHGGIMGSNPVGVTKTKRELILRIDFSFFMGIFGINKGKMRCLIN